MARMGEAPQRLWVRWLLLAIFVVALSVAFVNLGQWQLNRLDQRRDRNSVVVEHENAPVVGYETIMNRKITEEDQWQRVSVTGTFDAEHQLLARYRSNDGRTGWEIVTPLRASDGRVVLVNRGFVERSLSKDYPTVLPAPPSGTVTVTGHVRRNEVGKENATVPEQGTIRLISSDHIGAWMGEQLVDGYIGLLSVDPPQDGDFVPVRPPELSEGPHFWYAVQWFMFTALAGVGLIVMVRGDIKNRKSDDASKSPKPTPAARG